MWKISLKDQAGQSVVIIALVMIGLVAMVGLAIDGGEVYLSRRDAQNASDAGAFAGARVLTTHPANDTTIRAAINTFAQENHVANTSDIVTYFLDKDGNQIGTSSQQIGTWGTVPSNATGIVVTSTVGFQPFLISIIQGGTRVDIPARAKIQTGRLSASPSDLMPVTIACKQNDEDVTDPCGFQPNVPHVLQGDTIAPGGFQWTTFPESVPDGECMGATPNDIADFLRMQHNPPPPTLSSGVIPEGDWLCANTGNSYGNQVRDALYWWLQKPEGERVWIVPIFDCKDDRNVNVCDESYNGQPFFHIRAFGAFILTGYDFQGGKGTGNGKGSCKDNGGSGGSAPQRFPCEFNQNNQDCRYKDANNNWVYVNQCIQGKFVTYVGLPGPVSGEKCNQTGLDVCGMELKE